MRLIDIDAHAINQANQDGRSIIIILQGGESKGPFNLYAANTHQVITETGVWIVESIHAIYIIHRRITPKE